MKAIVGLVVIAGVGLAIYYAAGTAGSMVDPTEQGKEKRAIIETCASWTEVLDRAGAPRRWRDGTSGAESKYEDGPDEATRALIAGRLEQDEFRGGGFSFLYRFSDAVTFSVNFNRKGKLSGIMDREGKSALMDAAGG